MNGLTVRGRSYHGGWPHAVCSALAWPIYQVCGWLDRIPCDCTDHALDPVDDASRFLPDGRHMNAWGCEHGLFHAAMFVETLSLRFTQRSWYHA